MRIKPIITLLAVVFVIALAVVVGTRMSSDAIAILVGVIAGVAASVPTALLLIAVTQRREEEYVEPYEEQQRPAMPPVIVVAPNAMPQALPPYGSGYGQQAPLVQQPRRFRVMGYDDEEPDPAEAGDESASWYQ